jgi:UDPglucose--hexose-1-phosphate uridylyltransferase
MRLPVEKGAPVISGPVRTELRKDPTSGQWVLVRNWTPQPRRDDECPFCPGHESETPPEIAAYRTNGHLPNSSEWLVRVIPDRAPLLQIEGDIQREGLGIYDSVSGRGASEVVIEHPVHGAAWDHLPAEDVERVLWMYRARVEDLYQDAQIRSVLIRRREHRPADPITHPFSRIFGAPIVFDDLRRELAAARHHFARKQRCLYCDIIHQERQDGRRVVMETSSFLVYAPYGARRPFETWLVPTTHRHSYSATSPGELGDLSRTLQAAFRRLRAVQPSAPVDFTLHTAPNAGMRLREDEWRSLPEDYHWHIELAPDRESREDIGGFAVNPVPPEEAARQLRDAM